MLIWGALLIPVAAALIVYFMFHEKVVWWEAAIFLVAALIIVIMKFSTEGVQTHDTEWLTDQLVSVEHHEKYVREWEEWVPEQGHYETDSKGNSTYVVDVPAHWETRTEHHPEHWDKITNGGKSYRVSQQEYNRILAWWARNGSQEIYTDLKHSDQRHRFGCPGGQNCHCSDGRGDMFHVRWPGSRSTIEPLTWTQGYENRIQASHSVFKFPEVPEEVAKNLYALPKPDSNHNTPAILGDGGPTKDTADKELMRWNALIGPRPGPNKDYLKAGRLWILMFKNGNVQDAIDQENYWNGGNKNELTLCIGVDSNYKIEWAYVISWTKNEKLKIDIRQFVTERTGKELNLNDVVAYMGKECYDRFERREFAEFSYLTVNPPGWAVITTYILVTLASVGIGVFVVMNPFTHDNPTGETRRRYGYRRRFR
jgi:hypothetical protein